MLLSENYLLAPHLSGSLRKRAASGGRLLPRKVHMQVERSTMAYEPSSGVPEIPSQAALSRNTISSHIQATRFLESPPLLPLLNTSSMEFPCAQPRNSIMYDDEENEENEKNQENEENEAALSIPVIQRPQCAGIKSRSFFQIEDRYKLLVIWPATKVQQYTLFENAMLNPDQVGQLLTEVWENAQRYGWQDLECTKKIDGHVSHCA